MINQRALLAVHAKDRPRRDLFRDPSLVHTSSIPTILIAINKALFTSPLLDPHDAACLPLFIVCRRMLAISVCSTSYRPYTCVVTQSRATVALATRTIWSRQASCSRLLFMFSNLVPLSRIPTTHKLSYTCLLISIFCTVNTTLHV